MLVIETQATVKYACYVNGKDEELIKTYAEENDIPLELAVEELYGDSRINLYTSSYEIDFDTDEILKVEDCGIE